MKNKLFNLKYKKHSNYNIQYYNHKKETDLIGKWKNLNCLEVNFRMIDNTYFGINLEKFINI